ncbi:MAG TPA: hypothetical protein DD473_00505 [Planctomycetaceae bacterium]|nr:hypothetical protein [Planctomycetaceae bacterium]|tara:strand:+ start:168 stop:542 length:375 start_codon:yes stop_codon:yes gene_type:complete
MIGELRKLGIKNISRQTVRNILKEEEIQPGPAILIHDRDAKYTKTFRETVEAAGMKMNSLPKASPNLNGRCERFIETINLECLNKYIAFGKKHLDYLTVVFTSYNNEKKKPHGTGPPAANPVGA